MSNRAKAFIGMVVLAGTAILAVGSLGFHSADPARFLGYLAVALFASILKVSLPGITGTMSVNFLFILIGIVELTLPETMLIAWTATVFQCFWKAKAAPKPVQ